MKIWCTGAGEIHVKNVMGILSLYKINPAVIVIVKMDVLLLIIALFWRSMLSEKVEIIYRLSWTVIRAGE